MDLKYFLNANHVNKNILISLQIDVGFYLQEHKPLYLPTYLPTDRLIYLC